MFESILEELDDSEGVIKLTPEEVAREMEEYPGIPQIYLDFMRVVGWGDLGGWMIYSGLIDAREIFAKVIPSSTRVALFGDNFRGSYFQHQGGIHISEVMKRLFP